MKIIGFFMVSVHFQVDFGCGSGSLLDSLLEHPTTLEKLVGVDISRKGLTRAAKVYMVSLA
jgi:predicted TPR repeat methyltransferase